MILNYSIMVLITIVDPTVEVRCMEQKFMMAAAVA